MSFQNYSNNFDNAVYNSLNIGFNPSSSLDIFKRDKANSVVERKCERCETNLTSLRCVGM